MEGSEGCQVLDVPNEVFPCSLSRRSRAEDDRSAAVISLPVTAVSTRAPTPCFWRCILGGQPRGYGIPLGPRVSSKIRDVPVGIDPFWPTSP